MIMAIIMDEYGYVPGYVLCSGYDPGPDQLFVCLCFWLWLWFR